MNTASRLSTNHANWNKPTERNSSNLEQPAAKKNTTLNTKCNIVPKIVFNFLPTIQPHKMNKKNALIYLH